MVGKLLRLPQIVWFWFIDRIWARWWLRQNGVVVEQAVELVGLPALRMQKEGRIRLGKGVRLVSRRGNNPLFIDKPCVLRLLRPGASISIGAHSALSGTVICSAESVTIGEHVLIGANCMIVDTDFHPLDPAQRRLDRNAGAKSKPIVIEDDVFIGTQAIILKGTHLGAGCVVGAGAVVSGVFRPGSMIVGNPAKVIESK